MLRTQRKRTGDVLDIALTGVVDETSDLSKEFEPAPVLNVNTKGVERINSAGTRQWITLFRSLRQTGSKINFFELTAPLVEQANMLKGFAEKSEVRSLYVVFFCPSCGHETKMLFEATELVRNAFALPPQACPKCKASLDLDIFPDEYFKFLKE